MAKGDFARLREWAEENDYTIAATQPKSSPDGLWHVTVDLTSPVKLHAAAASEDIDAAASDVITTLEAVGESLA